MRDPDVIIIGGGQSGLAMSRSLTAAGVEHLVLERGRIGERWHAERWRSLHLLTTTAQSALPGMPHSGDPGSFMPAAAFASYLDAYAATINAPALSGVDVIKVERFGAEYRVTTTAGHWRARAVVIATGACDTPFRPAMAAALAPSILQVSPSAYREPAQLPDGGVLVVGASATGVQLAEEIHASGRPVVLAVGGHTRMPRRYRGADIIDQLEVAGILDEPLPEGARLALARRQPSLQLVGRTDPLDLGVLASQGLRLVGRLAGIDGTKAAFGGDLASTAAASHMRMVRTLDRIDAALEALGIDGPAADPAARAPFQLGNEPLTLDLRREGIRAVVWATGYRRCYPWLKLPVLDADGDIVHQGGVTPLPGLFVLGLTYLRRRRSSFINGCGLDADDLAPLVRAHLDRLAHRVA